MYSARVCSVVTLSHGGTEVVPAGRMVEHSEKYQSYGFVVFETVKKLNAFPSGFL